MILLIVPGMLLVLIGIAYFAVDQCAKANFLFTYVREGRAKAIEVGDAFKKIVIAYDGYTLDDRWNIIQEKEFEEKFDKKETADPIPRADKFLMWLLGKKSGLRWVGFPPYAKVREYKFCWASQRVAIAISTQAAQPEKDSEKTSGELEREETLDDILLQDDIYLIKILEVEDKNLLPLDIRLFITLRVVNPYKALYRVQEWLEMITNSLRAICVPYIGAGDFSEMVVNKQALAKTIWK